MPVLLEAIDPDGTVAAVSDAWLASFGFSRAEVIGRPALDFIAGHARPGWRTRIVNRLMAGGECTQVGCQMLCRDGSLRDVLVTACLERTACGAPGQINAVIETVTQARHAERTLAHERERMANLLATTNVGTWEWNLHTGEMLVNERHAHLLGRTLEEMRGFSVEEARELVHPDDRALSRQDIHALLKGEIPYYERERRLRHNDGHYIWVLSRATVLIRRPNGRAEWMFGALKDISERKRQEAALRKSEAFLERTGRCAGVGGWELDLATGGLTFSAETARIHGLHDDYPPKWADALDFYAPEARPVFRAAIARSIAHGTGWDLELPFIQAGGRRIWVRSMGSANVVDGVPRSLIGALQDVTERVVQRLALAQSEANSRLILDNAYDMISRVGADGKRLYASAATARIYGVSPEEFMTSSALERIHPEDRPALAAAKADLLAGRVSEAKLNFRVQHPERGEVWAEYAARALFDETTSAPAGYISVTRDVTDRVRMEALRQERALERLQNAELDRLAREMAQARAIAEKANRAKTRFLAGMSHELRTPLNGILGYAQLLRMDGGLSPIQSERVDSMLVAGRHLLEMVSCVLDMSEIESETIEIQSLPVDIVALAEASISIVSPAAAAKGLEIRLAVTDGTPRRAISDPPRLRQVLLNLLGNAVKYTQRGLVELRIGTVADVHKPDSLRLRFEVADTGPGIAVDKIHLLFEAFERLNEAGAVVADGAGLGLSLAKRICGLLGGELGYQANPGGGSVFWMELPVTAEDQSADAPVRAADRAGVPPHQDRAARRSARVLVVDDVPINLDIAEAFLQSAGYEATCARSGAEAVAQAAAGDFDVILMDVRMPGIDGLEATRQIRALDDPRALVPIVALTAQAFTEQIEACRTAGMDTHLAKPYTPDALAEAVSLGIAIGKHRRAACHRSMTRA